MGARRYKQLAPFWKCRKELFVLQMLYKVQWMKYLCIILRNVNFWGILIGALPLDLAGGLRFLDPFIAHPWKNLAAAHELATTQLTNEK